jgi:hypothetical protein
LWSIGIKPETIARAKDRTNSFISFIFLKTVQMESLQYIRHTKYHNAYSGDKMIDMIVIKKRVLFWRGTLLLFLGGVISRDGGTGR